MMKYTSKLAYLLGLPVLVGVSILSVINVVNGGVSISVPVIEDLHKPILHSLFLSWGENQTYILLDQGNNRFDIKNGLVMGQDSQLSLGASFVAIGGGKKNKISTEGTQSNNSSNVSNSGIGGGLSNTIATESSVIGGGSSNVTFCNNCSSEQVNAVAGGYNNYAGDGGVVIGGSSNKIWGSGSSAAPGVIVGGQNNKLGGNGIVLGHGARGGNGSFSWNNPQPTGNSAAIWASSGVLVGTTDPITGINLVVNGAIKISTGEGNGLVGEIRMMSGCFYGYDGQTWYVINKNGSDDCPRTVCVFGSTLLQPGNLVDAYEEPYSANCISKKIRCNENGILGEEGKNYYPYCYDLGEPSCGDAVNQEYVWEPTVNLCLYGDPYGMTGSDTEYTWTCKHKDSPISCSATRKYDCGPNRPTGIGVNMGSEYYYFGDDPENTGWTYMDKSENLGICQWACAEGYEKVDGRNECKEIGSHSCIYSGDSLIVGNDNYFRNINQSSGSGQIAKLYRTEADAEKNPCSYVCRQESGRQPVGPDDNIHCAMCESGTEIRNGNYIESCQEIRNICKTGYRYLQDTNLCTKLGVCFSSAGLPANPPEGADLGQYEQPYQYLPLGVNLDWTYKNSTGAIQPNSCQYTCKPAHTHEGSTCKPPSCPRNLPNGQSTGGYVTHENPVVSNPSRELIDFEDRYQFDAHVENKTGCYYWCPARFQCNGKCYKNQTEAEEACAGVDPDDPIITLGNTYGDPGNETTYSCPVGWVGPFTGANGVTQICRQYVPHYQTTGYCGPTCNGCKYNGSSVVEAGGTTYYYYDCQLGYMEVNANPQTDPTCQDGYYRDSHSNQCVCVNCLRITSCSTGRKLENNKCRQLQCRGDKYTPPYLRGLFGSSGTVNREGINEDLYYHQRIFTGESGQSECQASGCCLYCSSSSSIGSATYDGYTVCLGKCGPNQYFNPSGRGNTCTSCANVELEPDPDKSHWLYVDGHQGDPRYGTPTSCVNKCPNPELMWEPVDGNPRGHCVPISQEATQCPEGWTQSSIVGQQIVCSRPPTVVQW